LINLQELVTWKPKVEKKEEQNLLFAEDLNKAAPRKKEVKENKTAEQKKKDEIKYPHLKNKIWIELVHDTNAYLPGQIPPQMRIL
jgi:hypothetical protein